MRLFSTRARLVLLSALACGILLPAGAFAQTSGGSLQGEVTDQSGAALPGATITATNGDTGLTRSAQSGTDGRFLIVSLPVGSYKVDVALDSFGTVTVENVRITVATPRQISVQMAPAATVTETVTVTAAEAPLVSNTPAIGTVVSRQELESLPLNGRQFANLAVLAPGTQLAYNSDPTKPGQLTIALNGGIGRNVNFTVDGGDNTDDTIGGALQNFNLEAVEEFKIQTMMYKAEYGRSSGGVLTVVTKTGTNEFSASAWDFERSDSWNSKTETERLAGIDKQPYDRQQYGATLGGPIVRDRAHFFGTYEKTKRETSYTQITDGLLPGDGRSVALPFEDELLTVKGTVNISAAQYLQVRYGYQKNADKYGASPLATPDSLGTVSNEYSSWLAGHTWQAGAAGLNEFIFQYAKFDNLISADSSNPTIYFPSGAHTGQNINTPQSTHQVKYQYKDDFSWSQDLFGVGNDFKVGAQYVHEPTLGGDFSTGLTGQFSRLSNSPNAPITDITFFGGFFGDSTPVDQYSVFVQDDLHINDRLTLAVGFRYDKWTGFDLDQRTNPIWQTLSTQTRFHESYLNDFAGGKGGVLSNDDNNFAPRLGFTYDLKGDGRMLLRGGYGTYYDFPYTNATILFPASAVQSNYGVVYNVGSSTGIRNPDGSFFQPGQPLPPNGLPGADIPPPNEVASPTLATPYSDQASLGFSWQATDSVGVNLEVVTIEYHDIPYRFRANPFTDPNGNHAVDPDEPRRFPDFGSFRIWYGNGRASYDGVNLGVRVRQDKFELQGFYTYSVAKGNVLAGADEFRITDRGYQPGLPRDESINPLDPQCGACFGHLDTDARHKLTFGGTYNAPFGINVSGMFRYRSATPYTLLGGDRTGDGYRDLAPGVTKVNTARGHSFSQLDVRLARDFNFGDFGFELIGEMFNVFDEKNPNNFTVVPPTGIRATAFAGDPVQGEQRLMQFGVRLHWH